MQQSGHGGGKITKKREHITYAIAIALCVVLSLVPLAGAAENQNLVNNNLKTDLNNIDSNDTITNQSLLGMSEEEITQLKEWLKEKKINKTDGELNDGLKISATGDEVTELQRWLQANDFYSGKINGKFDVDTENAVKKFQKAMGLAEDGEVGVYTLQAMQQWDEYAEMLNSLDTGNVVTSSSSRVTGSSSTYTTKRTYRRSYSSYSRKGVGDCWTNSAIMYNQLTRSGQKARIIQYSTSLSPRHRSVQVYKNGRWVNADYSGYGYRYQPTKNAVNGVVVK
jgi:N-acetylmuramoyl-L-alanine amidase